MHRIGVLISGKGSLLPPLFEAVSKGDLPATIDCVISDRPSATGLAYAREQGVETMCVDRRSLIMSSTAPQSSDVHNQQVPPATHPASTLSEAFHAILSPRVDLIVLAGFLSILGEPLLSDFAGSVINIHPALLPRHGGKGMYGMHVHREVIEQGDKESGCSVHYVTAGIDRGPIILQKKVPVHPDDTPETLQQRVHEIEGPTLVEALKRHIEDNADISQRV